jgi:hypothetical protein
MRDKYGKKFQYACVEHRQGDMVRRNVHVVVYGTGYLDKDWCEKTWARLYGGSFLSKIELVWSAKGLSFYLSKYLTSEESFVRSWTSQGWVFPGWWDFNLYCKRTLGFYPSAKLLAELSKQTQYERITNSVPYLNYWLSIQDKLKARLEARLFLNKPTQKELVWIAKYNKKHKRKILV